MEHVGEFSGEGDWSALNGIMFSTDEAHAMAHWFGGHPSLGEQERGVVYGVPSAYLPSHEPDADGMEFDENVYDGSDSSNNANSYYVRPGNCFLENYNFSNFNNAALLVNYGSSFMGEQSNSLSNEEVLPKGVIGKAIALNRVNGESSEDIGKTNVLPFQKSQPKRKIGLKQEDEIVEDQSNTIGPENPRKENRVSGMVQGGKKPLSKKSRKNVTKFNSDDEETSNADLNGQSSTSYSSEDDTNASQEINGAAASSSSKESETLNSSGKTRAKRGSATDPQSLYARKRRERINERLRILQNLVPNGTKVDISTMLEEAVQYVKFLQLQIKLLSSDDLWMYAPIAYNGMNIGLDLNISP